MEKLLARASPGQARESTIRTARRCALEPAAPGNLAGQAAATPLLLQQHGLLIDCFWSSSRPLLHGCSPAERRASTWHSGC